MKIKTLVAICKKAGAFYLYDRVTEDGEVAEQWLGNGGAVFPLFGLPYLQEDNIYTLFDIQEKQQEKIFFRHERLPEGINFGDADAHESMLDREKLAISYAQKELRPLQTGGGLVFIDTENLAPLADIADTMELFERRTESGGTYIVAKSGFMLMGVIMPCNVIEESFVVLMETLARKCRVAHDTKARNRAEREDQTPQEQIHIN